MTSNSKRSRKSNFIKRKRSALKKTQNIRKQIETNNRNIESLLAKNSILYNELIHRMIYLL